MIYASLRFFLQGYVSNHFWLNEPYRFHIVARNASHKYNIIIPTEVLHRLKFVFSINVIVSSILLLLLSFRQFLTLAAHRAGLEASSCINQANKYPSKKSLKKSLKAND